jgi:hypothetical protein
MKDMLGTIVVIGDTVIFANWLDEEDSSNLTGGVVKSFVEDEYGGYMVVEDGEGNIHNLISSEVAYYTTIKDLTLT